MTGTARGPGRRQRVAIVGSGIAGLAAAHALQGHADITLFEAGAYFGGHTHTVDVTLPGKGGTGPVTHGVDTGFLVFNERTYPQLIQLFAELGVETARSDMSFSVKVPDALRGSSLEWSGSSLNTVFAQRGNLVNPKFLRMLADIVRFNRITTALAHSGADAAMLQPLGDFLRAGKFSAEFRDWYFLPMMGCIWSCPTDQMLQFPVATMIRFCHNHGLIQITNRPQWWTVQGGAHHYVDKIVQGIGDKRLNTPVRSLLRDATGVHIRTDAGIEHFDKVVLAAHSDESLALLDAPSAAERETLGAIRYQPNRAVLHTDASVLPDRRLAWSAWNYERPQGQGRETAGVCLHYLLNMLQPLPFAQPVVVSLNPARDIARNCIMGEFEYAHPVFDLAAIKAQKGVPALQGRHHTYFCGAWTGYGFHEDGLKSGLLAARLLLAQAAGNTGTPGQPAWRPQGEPQELPA
ncbi:MAG: NAD/FAD-binding protein [Polaromonas sp. 39-63-203]|jgi:predicted NAD/FAD-binding protein|uniref:NAD(P)/FAD-dependent oxidoreductase n=1 Tax=Polaromonas sp. TaxID=1869339 RepID=UPI000BD7A78A|nr:FAD-dependent oxidoreductase [Polaromonas sp.]OYY52476.1 MAG: NAD/FAD-binding protein [Polaromonas sp. 35-63-240]OYZ84241.1 MAG: NAD/FAD-binding protein [Polaromonas sp. 24-62-144]OZA99512.1 MAG: NAD/FAD-binding protein [Polaromonas sp. 39-63-203]HQS32838.1 FAD-dependent oxidoreductase [Polaromonas sp.]HQS89444.1 FAD-dependent oxidoreductase [Polaromonas sp.]